MHIQIDRTSRQVLAYGFFPAPSPDPNILTVTLPDTVLATLQQAGTKTLGADGVTITVTPPSPGATAPPPPPAKVQTAVTTLKALAGTTGVAAQLAQALLDYHGIT